MWSFSNRTFDYLGYLSRLCFSLTLFLTIPVAYADGPKPNSGESCRGDVRFTMGNQVRKSEAPKFANSIASSNVPYREMNNRFKLDDANTGYEFYIGSKRVVAKSGIR